MAKAEVRIASMLRSYITRKGRDVHESYPV